MSDTDLHHLAAAYALDALDADERIRFEAHYPSCEVCHSDVVAFRDALGDMAAASKRQPSADLKARVMAEIAETRQLSPRVLPGTASARSHPGSSAWRNPVMIGAIAAGLVAAVGFGIAAIRPDGVGYGEAAAEILAHGDARMVDLEGSAGGDVRVAWSLAAGEAVLIADGLADPGDGHAYELWLIDAAGPHALGVLDDADDGSIRRVIEMDAEGTQFGITIEPEDGSATPTMPVLFSAAT